MSAIHRRGFLQGAGALVISFAFAPLASVQQAPRGARADVATVPAGAAGPPDPNQLDAWLAIDAAGLVTLFSGKVELGTGVQTALSQIVAEELDVPVARVRVIQGDTRRSPDQGTTAGSKTLQMGGVQVRRAGAEARRVLLELASTTLATPIAELSVTDGIVHRRGTAIVTPPSAAGSNSTGSNTARSNTAGAHSAASNSAGSNSAGSNSAGSNSAGSNGTSSNSERVSYADLIGGRTFSRTIVDGRGGSAANANANVTARPNAASPPAAPSPASSAPPSATAATSPATVKAPADYHIVGQPVPRVDLPAKMSGSHEYVHNVRVPGMVHGRVVRPPAIGATLASLDESSARALPGVLSIVRHSNFVGIIAEREEQAMAAARALTLVWTPPAAPLPSIDTLDATIRATPVTERVLVDTGDRAAATASATHRVEASYSIPFQSHASIGPSCAVADVRDGEATIWSGTQGAYALRDAIAALLELPQARVHVIWTEASGCYGHNGADDVAADAAVLSKAVGRPVRVQWTRQDEHGWAPKGPAMVMDARAALGASGEIVAWDYAVTTPTHLTRPSGRAPANLLAAQLMGQTLTLGAGGGDRNARPSYEVANVRAVARWMQQSVIRPSAFRGLGAPANVFAVESFMDELAAAAGSDPIEFRLRHLRDPRAIAVIRRVAEIARWQPRRASASPSPSSSASTASTSSSRAAGDIVTGRGFSFLQYENVNTYVAAVIDVTVDRRTGYVRATRLFAAHDCGLIVNPDGLRNQIEGGLLQGISRALKEQVRWDERAVTTIDWQTYPILTFSDAPDSCEIALIDRPDQPSLGAGEAAHCAAPAAIANAIADATGHRLRALPFTSERVKSALKAGSRPQAPGSR